MPPRQQRRQGAGRGTQNVSLRLAPDMQLSDLRPHERAQTLLTAGTAGADRDDTKVTWTVGALACRTTATLPAGEQGSCTRAERVFTLGSLGHCSLALRPAPASAVSVPAQSAGLSLCLHTLTETDLRFRVVFRFGKLREVARSRGNWEQLQRCEIEEEVVTRCQFPVGDFERRWESAVRVGPTASAEWASVGVPDTVCRRLKLAEELLSSEDREVLDKQCLQIAVHFVEDVMPGHRRFPVLPRYVFQDAPRGAEDRSERSGQRAPFLDPGLNLDLIRGHYSFLESGTGEVRRQEELKFRMDAEEDREFLRELGSERATGGGKGRGRRDRREERTYPEMDDNDMFMNPIVRNRDVFGRPVAGIVLGNAEMGQLVEAGMFTYDFAAMQRNEDMLFEHMCYDVS